MYAVKIAHTSYAMEQVLRIGDLRQVGEQVPERHPECAERGKGERAERVPLGELPHARE
jgi:hypothetical protein